MLSPGTSVVLSQSHSTCYRVLSLSQPLQPSEENQCSHPTQALCSLSHTCHTLRVTEFCHCLSRYSHQRRISALTRHKRCALSVTRVTLYVLQSSVTVSAVTAIRGESVLSPGTSVVLSQSNVSHSTCYRVLSLSQPLQPSEENQCSHSTRCLLFSNLHYTNIMGPLVINIQYSGATFRNRLM